MKNSKYEDIGYSYIVFQHHITDYIKCYLDGNEDYTFFDKIKFYDLAEKSGGTELANAIRKAMSTTGIFLWDVENRRIKRLFNKNTESSLVKDINEIPKVFSGFSNYSDFPLYNNY